MKTFSTKLTFSSFRKKINALTVVLFLTSQMGIAQCYVAVETNPSFVANVGCGDGTLRLGAGANFTIPVSPNTNYIFSWANGGNSNGYCGTPNVGGAFSNLTTWNSGGATSLNISSSRITGAGWNGTSGVMTYRNATPTNATSTASASAICIGSSVSILGGGGINGILYYQGTTSNGINTSTTANPQVFNPGSVGTATYYWRANNNGCWGTEAGATVTVSPATVGGTATATAPTTCINTTMTINLSGQTGTVLDWEWNFNGGAYTSIGNAGLNNITSPTLTSAGTYQFRVRVQSGTCASMYSSSATVSVSPISVGGTASAALTAFCSGGNTTISVSGQTGTILSWERNANGGGWVNIGNGGLSIIPTGALTTGNYEYRAIIQSTPCASITSSIALVTVDDPSVGGNTAASGTLVCSGDNPTVTLTGNTGAVMYWERQINGGGFNNIGNAGSSSISTGAITPGVYDYRAVVQSGTCSPATSTSASITVSSPSVGGAAVPQDATLCQGGSTNINLSGYNGAIVNWEQQENGGGYNTIGSAGLNVIGSGALNTAGNIEFRAVVQNGGCPAVQSSPASVTVNPTSVGGAVSANVTTLCAGGTADLTLSGQTGSIVGWERQFDGGGWTNIGNAGINPLTTAVLNVAGVYEYRAIVQSGICPPINSASVSITVNPFDIATFNYSSSVFCQGGTNPSPSVVQGGGTFSATPAGLVIDAATGIIDLGASAVGTYSITHTTSSACPATANQSVTIVGGANASFSYSNLNYCLDGSNAIPTAVNAGGTFTSSPAGIIFANASTGEIDFTNSVDGSYYVTYTLPGACPSSQMQTVNLIDPGNSSFAYASNAYCVGGTNPSPSIAQFGGTFSASPLGLVFTNAQTGTIDLTNSVANTYTITYNSGGPCPTTSTQTITINAAGDPLFFYSASTFCQASTNPTPFVSAPGGSFTSSPAGLLFVSPVSGEISLSTSLPGGYVVTYNTGGLCPSTYSNNVLVVANQNAAFTYSQAAYCQNDVDPTPNVAQIGGTFTASPAGLVFDNQFTGRIDLSASSAGTYTVTYTVPGTCIGVYTRQVIINAGGAATLSYPSSSFCSSGTNPIPTFSPAGGTFTASPGGLAFVSATTGEVNLAASLPGTYTITYASSGACASAQTQTVTISPAGNSSFAYSANAYCVGSTSNPSPSIAQFGGTFSASPLGLVFTNTQTGTIDLTNSVANTYTITYSSGGICPSTSTQTITINAAGDPLFFYSASTFCQDASNPIPFVSAAGGSFTSSPAGLLFVSPVSGEISLSTSLPGGYVVTYNTGGLCPSTYSNNVLVVANQNAAFTYSQAAYCQNDVDPTPNVAQIGGTFTASPAGLVFDNQFTGRIDLSASSAGTYTVTYTVPGTCIGVYTRQVIINAGAAATVSYPASSFCSNGSDPAATVSPAGGTFTSSPLGLSVDGSGTIDLSASVPGAYTVNYTAAGACASAASANVIIVTSPQAFIQPVSPLCTGSSPIILTASPSGGTWSGGAYISPTGTFDPSVSGSGSFPINYAVTGSGGCNASATYNVVVNTSATVSITPAGPFCSNDSIQVLTASPLGGTWSGNPFVSINGLFFPAEAGAGVYPVMYTVNSAGGCANSTVVSIQVLNSPTPAINPVAAICASGSPIGLSANISGGTWSGGAYVSASGTFNPALASVGNNLVTYTVTNGSCTAQSTAQIAVSGNPNVNIITPSPFCQNSSPAFLSVNLPGGVFSGGSYINGSGLFNPSLAAVGNNVAIYTMTGSNGCVGSDTVNVLVNANPDATITYPGTVCQDDAPFSLTAATTGGTWSGGAYVNSGVFDPAVAGPGAHTVTYNVTTGGCSATSTISITVNPNPAAAFIYQPNALFAYFTNLSQNEDTWTWNFGDGSAEVTTQNPTHEFPDNGVYQVRLIVSNDCGSDTLVLPVFVNKNVGIEENAASTSFNIFPNPTDQYLQLTASGLDDGEWKLNVLDVSGKTVMQEMMYPSAGILNKTMDVYVLKPGVYFINLQNGKHTHTMKFVKM